MTCFKSINSSNPKIMVSFSAPKTELLEVFKKLKAGHKHRSKKVFNLICEVTITDNKATFTVAGATINLSCTTKGVAKFTLPLYYFEDLIKTHKDKNVSIEIHPEEIKIGTSFISANITYIENDDILRSIDLPLNFTDIDLINLISDHYTEDEISFNNLREPIEEALARFDQKIRIAYKPLKAYKIPFDKFQSAIYELITPLKP